MATRTADELVADYLERLDEALADLPRARREEIVQEVSEHIDAARSELATPNEAEIRTLLDRIGDPAEIAAAAGARPAERPGRRWVEVTALVLLLLGGFIGLIGWLVGVVLLWVSDVWTKREKLLGTLVLPFGLVGPFLLFFFVGEGEEVCRSAPVPAGGAGGVVDMTCTGGPSTAGQALWVVVTIVLFVAPFATVAYLGRRIGRRPLAASPA